MYKIRRLALNITQHVDMKWLAKALLAVFLVFGLCMLGCVSKLMIAWFLHPEPAAPIHIVKAMAITNALAHVGLELAAMTGLAAGLAFGIGLLVLPLL